MLDRRVWLLESRQEMAGTRTGVVAVDVHWSENKSVLKVEPTALPDGLRDFEVHKGSQG